MGHCHHCERSEVSTTSILGLGLPLLVMSFLPLFGVRESLYFVFAQFALASLILILGSDTFTAGFKAWKKPDMNTLITLGVGVAYVYSLVIFVNWVFSGLSGTVYFSSAGLVMAFVLFGRNLEHKANTDTKNILSSLLSFKPEKARLYVKGKEKEIPVSEVKVGNVLRVKPGDRIPVDGVITVGNSRVDESMLTGESKPVKKKIHDEVFAGTINKTGMFVMTVTATGKETAYNRIVNLVQEAQKSKAPVQRTVDSVANVFVPIVLLIAIITFFYWFNTSGLDFALLASVSVLVIACPCALGLATPVAVVAGIGSAGVKGILFKNATAIQQTAEVNTVAFDKTGTLTQGKPEVVFIKAYDVSESIILRYAASLESVANHHLGVAIMDYAKLRKVNFGDPRQHEVVDGFGVKGKVEGRKVVLGNVKMFLKENIGLYDIRERLPELAERKLTPVLIAVDGKLAGLIGIQDPIRESARETVTSLKKLNIKPIMLTGDSDETAKAVSHQVGIPVYRSQLSPKDKLNEVTRLQKKNVVAMVGDGVNDAPVLAKAHVGIAIGSGTDVAVDTADVVLIKDDLKGVTKAVQLSRKTMSVIKQNLVWAFGYNILAIPLAAGVAYPYTGFLINPALAGFLMAASSLSVVLNSLRLK